MGALVDVFAQAVLGFTCALVNLLAQIQCALVDVLA
jgi:hypothetical protein